MTRFGPAGRPAGKRAGSAPAGAPVAGARPTTATPSGPDATTATPAAAPPSERPSDGPSGKKPGRKARRKPDTTATRSAGTAALARRGAPWWLVALLGVLAVGGLVLSAVLLSRPSDAELRESAVAAATRYTEFLTTYDARTLEEDVARMAAVSTEEFAEEYRGTVEGLQARIAEQQATSTGSVVGSGVERLEGDTATVLVAVDQEITAAGQEPRTEANRVRMRLVREDGSWVVADVERL